MYMGDGSTNPTEYDLDPDNIFIPGPYNKATAIANLAVIRFNGDASDTYKAYGSTGDYTVADSSYTSRLLDSGSKRWRTANTIRQPDDYYEACKALNSVYEANTYFATCNSDTVGSIYNSDCRIPYGAMYSKMGDDQDVVLVAIYTHTVVMGTNECTDRRLNYFTYVHGYISYASWATGETLGIYYNKNLTAVKPPSSEPNVVINAGTPKTFGGMITVGPNLYARYSTVTASSPESSESNPSTSPDTSANNDSTKKSNKTGVIVGAVVGSVGGLLLIAAIIFFILRKKKQKKAALDPRAQQMAIFEMGNNLVVDVPNAQLPPYSQSQDTAPNFRVPDTTEEAAVAQEEEGEREAVVQEEVDEKGGGNAHAVQRTSTSVRSTASRQA
ncbi:hypothetical protein LPJ57_000547 [Coemansia sp. RSA 486]|nr:hypothetical protein LPJ57_000547 [Coemansia sp. RSA 486]